MNKYCHTLNILSNLTKALWRLSYGLRMAIKFSSANTAVVPISFLKTIRATRPSAIRSRFASVFNVDLEGDSSIIVLESHSTLAVESAVNASGCETRASNLSILEQIINIIRRQEVMYRYFFTHF